ncbi:MAG: PorT family protein [Bacteroidales bacterium]|jgi:hypothetical protein|nr:PorT family protein [Bacteroidales bacterium]
MNRIVIFFIAVGLNVMGIAQEESVNKAKSAFTGGVRAGFTASQISGDDLSGFNKFGGYAGLFANFPVVPSAKIKLQFELNFIMKGSHTYVSPGSTAFINNYALNLFYVEAPLLLKLAPFTNKLRGLEIEIGPAFNVLFHYIEKIDGEKRNIDEKFRWYEVALDIGIGYLFKEHYGINLRWSTSIIPVRKPEWRRDFLRKYQYNDLLAFSLFYQF